MAVSPATRRASEAALEAEIAALKSRYAAHLRALAAAFEPTLSASELGRGLELDEGGDARRAGMRLGRFLSDAPRNRHARPDRVTRALIDRIVQGRARLCARATAAGDRELLVCEPEEVARLGADWVVVDVARGRTSRGAAAAAAPEDDDIDWSGGAFGGEGDGDGDQGPGAAASSRHREATGPPDGDGPGRQGPGAAASSRHREATRPPDGDGPGRQGPGAAASSRHREATRPPDGDGPRDGLIALGPWRLPRVGLGLMRLSTTGRPDEANAIAVIHAALDAGVRLLDTADAYALDDDDGLHGLGLVRRALATWAGPRDEVVVATKVGLVRPGGRWIPNGRPEHLRRAVDRSLDALGVARLDLLQLHAPDPSVPLAESLGALAELAAAGKARALGVCNLKAGDLDAATVAAPLASLQVQLNAFDKARFADGTLARAADLGLARVAHSPLGGHRGRGRVADDRALGEVAARLGATPFEVALAWLLERDRGLFVIPGATRVERVASHARAARLRLDDAARATLAARFPWSRREPAVADRPRTSQGPPARRAPRDAPAPAVGPALVATPITEDALVAPPRDEVVLLMGIPAAGKTSAVRRFVDAGYVRLNRDLAGGRLDDLLPLLEAAHADGARRFVLDNTYTFRRARAGVTALAARLGLPVRCVHVGGDAADARYNAALRLFRKLGRLPDPDEIKARGKADPNTFPPAVIDHYAQSFEPPTADEGIARLERLAFVRRDPPDYTQPAVLLDLDGTVRTTRGRVPFPTSADDVVLLPRRREILAPWVDAGYRLFGVTNQAGVSLGQVELAAVEAANARTAALLELPITILACPHPPGRPTCWCRKPLPGMGVALIERYRLDRERLVMVGDRATDEGFAQGLGVPFVHADVFFHAQRPATPPRRG